MQTMFYSSSTGGFYDLSIHGLNIPGDSVEISSELHEALLLGQTQGRRIVPNAAGHPTLQDPPALTTDQLLSAVQSAVQHHLDVAARAAGYDDIKSAVTYAEEPSVPRFQAEGRALRAWRSLVWAKCYELLAKVQAGEIPMLNPEQVVSELPALVMP